MSASESQKIKLANIANQINNHLQTITGSASTLASVVAKEHRDKANQITQSVKQVSKLLNSLLMTDSNAPEITTKLELVQGGVNQSCKPEIKSDTILVIDDEDLVRYTVAVMLRRAGYRVIEASSGAEGIRLFEQERVRVFCVLLDLAMPFMPGNVVHAKLKNIAPDLVIYLMSGYSLEQALEECKGEEVSGFIPKPFQLADIMRAIESAQAIAKVENL